MEQQKKRKAMGYLSNALKITLGAGVALGGSYLLSRVSEKQETESSLSRLEQMLAELGETKEEPPPAAVEETASIVIPPSSPAPRKGGRGKKSVILSPEEQSE